MHLLVIFVKFLCSWFACTVKIELRVTIIAGEKCNPIIGTLCYMKMQEHISVGVHYIFLPSVYYNAGTF